MNRRNAITGFVIIRDNAILLNGKPVFEMKGVPAIDFFNAVYDALQINYPKFYKMDNLCKTGFLASEYLLHGQELSLKYEPEKIGVIFSNSNSSLDTDLRFQQTLATAPSPALFVYTLPNIVIGEICIRNQIKGESACFVFDIFDFEFQADYVNGLLDAGKLKACISGWADFYDGKFEAFFYLAEQTEDKKHIIHDSVNTDKIYQGTWKP